MSNNNISLANPDSLKTIAGENRVFSGTSYVLMWWSSLIVIQAFVLGQGFLPPIGRMNLVQAFLVLCIAGAMFVVMFSLNGQAGLKFGIPYAIQARGGFGVRGSKIVEFLRIVPAIIWYGIGTWIGALSFDAILSTLTGFTAPAARYVYFVVFQILQTWLAYRGIRTMKCFNATGSIIIAAVMAYMLIHLIKTYGLEIQESWTGPGEWGAPFWVGLSAAIGILATVMLNISDMTRHLKRSQSGIWLGHLLGILPPWFFMLSLGIIAGAAVGIWNPVDALMKLSPHPVAMLVLLTFILLAQFTTNLNLNILPPALVFMDTFKISWHQSVIVTGILGAISFPWLLMANSEAFFGFILYYSAFFGPILGVMLVDYFVIRKRELSVDALYKSGRNSDYWYSGGFNVAGLVAIFVPGIVTMIWFLPMAWMIGVPVAFVLYLLLFQPRSRRRSFSVSGKAV